LYEDNFLHIKFTAVIWNIACSLYSLYFPEIYFVEFGGKEPDHICY